jgi:hypothetical protein
LTSRTLSLGLCTAALLAAMAPVAHADTIVCNEAENSHRGGYVVTGNLVDPMPPAFLRGSTMRVGQGAGLEHAATQSPALRTCGPEGQDGGGDTGGGDTGGGDDGSSAT